MDTIIDRYLAAVSENLPAKTRQDTVTEIRSLIQDALDDRSKAEGRRPDEAMMAEVLKQFGPPEKIIAPYLPEKYLIGPRLFPIFILVIQIVLPIIAVLALVGFWVGLSSGGVIGTTQLVSSIAQSLGNALTAVLQAFGNIVIIFAILQWLLPEFRLASQEKPWDPHSLKAVSQPDKIRRGELITQIFFTLVGLIIFNFYLDRVGIYNRINDVWTFTPILTRAFYAYIPYLDLLWVLTILLDTVLLRRGSWDNLTRLCMILLNAFNIAILVSLATQIQYLYTLKGAFGQLGAEGLIQSVLNQVLIVVFAITIIVSLVRIVQMALRLVRANLSV
jgi:hypothetical protein